MNTRMVQLELRFPTRKELQKQLDNTPVGYLVEWPGKIGILVACPDCTACRVSPIYKVNILPYKQTCCDCGKLLVKGQTPAWCDLYGPRQGAS